jgi:UDP-N-acetylmuramate--alanine ligase
MINLEKINEVHFIGIGGIGMSAIARMFLLEGKKVSGSDRARSLVTEELEKLGAEIFYEQEEKNISVDTDLVIYTIAISEDNPELKKARELGIECRTYPEMLGIVSAEKYTVAVSGTHGKTTTTAMIAKVLIEADLKPTVIVGSLLKDQANGQKSNFIAGQSQYFVVEACEYRRSFLNLNPKVLVITNIDSDHLDYYKDLTDIQGAFREMVSKIPADGFLVCDPSDPKAAPVLSAASCQIIDYRQLPELPNLLVPGLHNIRDAQAAEAVGEILKISPELAKESLKKFTGTWRRFEYKGKTKNGASVYDDYAHHPTEITATIEGAREKLVDGKLIIAFQPHLYSRTKLLFDDFAKALSGADRVVLTKIYAAREPFDETVSELELVKKINDYAGKNIAIFVADLISVGKDLQIEANVNDIVVTMGAGDISLISDKLIG